MERKSTGMKKNFVWKTVLLSVVFALAVNVLFGRFITAKLSTLPILSSFNILSPQTPIVINTREEIRVNETGDSVRIVNLVKSKVSSVVFDNRGNLEFLGTAVNLTSDGLVLTTSSVIGQYKASSLLVKLNNGEFGEVTEITEDPATELVVLKTEAPDLSVVEFDDSEKIQVGERLVMIKAGLNSNFAEFSNSFVERQEADLEERVYNSDYPERSFAISSVGKDHKGSVLINNESKVVGIWDGEKTISSNIMQIFTRKALSNNGEILRPSFGFLYKPLNFVEEKELDLHNKVKVVKITLDGPASLAELKVGDIIFSIEGQELTQENSLEEVLERFDANDKLPIKVIRKDKELVIELEVGSMK